MEPKFRFDDAVFTYAVAPEPAARFSRHTPVMNGALTVSHTSKTDVLTAGDGVREIAVIGLCVDAHGEAAREDIPALCLERPGHDILSVYRFCDRFAGKYVILYRNGEGVYLFGDASGSVQINYSIGEDGLCAASIDRLAAEYRGYGVSEYSLKIRKGANLFQALPNDITMYDGVKALLPNHYLDVSRGQAVRVPHLPAPGFPDGAGGEEALRAYVEAASLPLIRHTVRAFQKYYELVCPLTAGSDSRAVLSFLLDGGRPECYTFHHKDFTGETAELRIPAEICRDLHLPYTAVKDLQAPEAYVKAVFEAAGDYHAPGTVDLAYTYLSAFSGKAMVNGDIIGQVGKSSKGKDIPCAFARAPFFASKIHNKSPLARRELERYIQEIRASGDWPFVFDLYATEIMNGRWSAQTHMLYSLCSISLLNIFNCRELIGQWMDIPRARRTRGLIHQAVLEETRPELLRYPVNPGEKHSLLRKHWLTYYLASHVKFYFFE